MRVFSVQGKLVAELSDIQIGNLSELDLPSPGYLWVSCNRGELEQSHMPIQAALQRWCSLQLVDLHLADLLNAQLPSRFDYTSQYDLLVFRRLAVGTGNMDSNNELKLTATKSRGGPPIMRRIDTSPVGFVVLDRVLLTVHPQECTLRDSYADRLLMAGGNTNAQAGTPDARSAGARGVPSHPADLMLRIVNHAVDSFLALRRELSHQLDHWQAELMDPKARFANWRTLLDARQTLHQLDEICEDQRIAIQDWIETLKSWPDSDMHLSRHERDLLQVRSRDVLEHIERVVHHVRQLEQNAETAVQIHFSAQSHRTNEIMRTLTVLTAIFLPLNLVTGFFGMNFETMPLVHQQRGLWWAIGLMMLVALALVLFFWRKRYLSRSSR
ncbi:MAG: magnesium transporter CorA family protein [Rhodoferax sp.]|uniref:magnesium transporter CorA family protein n=1 Tax=Rhodoferax sp. TaxID=50421 RepID=UPI001B5C94C4|nr:magnesium transporter CorA family protein [Rhodoferax sp.]MBP9735392.1 magnesium transporter CorA family protein [Rhodoferax sp.]